MGGDNNDGLLTCSVKCRATENHVSGGPPVGPKLTEEDLRQISVVPICGGQGGEKRCRRGSRGPYRAWQGVRRRIRGGGTKACPQGEVVVGKERRARRERILAQDCPKDLKLLWLEWAQRRAARQRDCECEEKEAFHRDESRTA